VDGADPVTGALDRLVEFDDRSWSYPVRALVTNKVARSYTWRCNTWLDQGTEGACVGFSWAHELAARPYEWNVDAKLATGIFRRARVLDEWPGEDYDGTSVLAGAKAVLEKQWIDAYRWAFSLDDLVLAVSHEGPAILGIYWHAGMMEPDRYGWVRRAGGVVGGHAILCRGVNVSGQYFLLRNSWGQGWGANGDCKVRFSDMADLLADDGEACVPDRRRTVR
jgi:hypothetical protein